MHGAYKMGGRAAGRPHGRPEPGMCWRQRPLTKEEQLGPSEQLHGDAEPLACKGPAPAASMRPTQCGADTSALPSTPAWRAQCQLLQQSKAGAWPRAGHVQHPCCTTSGRHGNLVPQATQQPLTLAPGDALAHRVPHNGSPAQYSAVQLGTQAASRTLSACATPQLMHGPALTLLRCSRACCVCSRAVAAQQQQPQQRGGQRRAPAGAVTCKSRGCSRG